MLGPTILSGRLNSRRPKARSHLSIRNGDFQPPESLLKGDAARDAQPAELWQGYAEPRVVVASASQWNGGSGRFGIIAKSGGRCGDRGRIGDRPSREIP